MGDKPESQTIPDTATPTTVPKQTTAPRVSISERLRQLAPTLFWVAIAAGAFLAAYASSITSYAIVLYLFALVQLSRGASWRKGYYSGLAVGFLIATLLLSFFWRIFSGGDPLGLRVPGDRH